MSLNILTNFEIQKYYQNQPKFNGVYSRNNSAKIKDGAYVINLDECKSIGTLWIAWYVNGNNGSYFVWRTINNKLNLENYFDNFGVEHSPKEFIKFIGNKNIKIL